MVLPGHIAGGYLVTTIVFSVVDVHLSSSSINTLYALGILSGELPDIDLLYHAFSRRFFGDKTQSHRDFITHSPLFWLVFCLVLLALSITMQNDFVKISAILIFAGTWCHFIFDSIEYGVRWLSPFSNKRFCVVKKVPHIKTNAEPGSMRAHLDFVQSAYFKTWTFWAELSVSLLALVVAISAF